MPPDAIPGPHGGWLIPPKLGEVRNPSGMTGEAMRARKLAQEHSPEAVEKIVQLMRHGKDERTQLVAATQITKIAGLEPGNKPKSGGSDQRPTMDISRFTPAELEQLRQLLLSAASRQAKQVAEAGAQGDGT